MSNRAFERAESLAGRAIRFDWWEQEFMKVDILVSATFLLTVAKLEPIVRRRRQRPVFILDLALPRDVEPVVHELDGVYLYDLDSLEVTAAKRREADLGQQLVLRHVRDFSEWLERASSAWPALASGVMVGSPGRW